jgi:hypothetical protein
MVFNKLNLNFNKEKVRCESIARHPSPSLPELCRSLPRWQFQAEQKQNQMLFLHT